MTPEQRINMREAAFAAIAKYAQLGKPKEYSVAVLELAKHVLKLLDEIKELETTIKRMERSAKIEGLDY